MWILHRLLFWVEGQDDLFVIRRSSLDGSPPENITTSSVSVLDLSVDSVTQTLYWVTAEGSVCSSSFGWDNTVCFYCCNDAAPSGITVFEVFIYLSLNASNSVMQIQKDLGKCVYACLCGMRKLWSVILVLLLLYVVLLYAQLFW